MLATELSSRSDNKTLLTEGGHSGASAECSDSVTIDVNAGNSATATDVFRENDDTIFVNAAEAAHSAR